jgi:hypothetical protein
MLNKPNFEAMPGSPVGTGGFIGRTDKKISLDNCGEERYIFVSK